MGRGAIVGKVYSILMLRVSLFSFVCFGDVCCILNWAPFLCLCLVFCFDLRYFEVLAIFSLSLSSAVIVQVYLIFICIYLFICLWLFLYCFFDALLFLYYFFIL